ncbi:MAG TPA: type II toxin-antitoxin system prevent-host-death family antitoxin [Anaerolineae bacterium]|nr:type II toxin-antitoxin system prevent-host-death family antitoxin [Anaerolineae bacterium]HIP73392.1 type II toxin-antitoxin system prevent-host-death family antitoxin [Anaerolineae bacterium]
MPIQITYTQARENFAKFWDDVTQNRETIIITRRGAENVALISETELSSLQETAHLLRSPKNAERLLEALAWAQAGGDAPQTIDELRREVGLEQEETP